MNAIVFVLMVICTHGEDNKQLLVDAFPFEKMEKCQSAEATVKKEMAKGCNQLATKCQDKAIIK